jgi:Ca2+-binding RTX toxin-like protein
VIGDHGRLSWAADNGVQTDIAEFSSTETTYGAGDTVQGNADDDVVIGGAGADTIDGNAGDDLIFGDAATLVRQPTTNNPRFTSLSGDHIYSRTDLDAINELESGELLVTGIQFPYRTSDGTVPDWARFVVTALFHSQAIQDSANAYVMNTYGGDDVAGGAGDDIIFGQLGNDRLQGDGDTSLGVGCGTSAGGGPLATPCRDGDNELGATASGDDFAGTDGDDYVEGGGGDDVMFGNLGQDELIGGSSSLFSLTTYERRPDGLDLIFGGSGTRAGHNDTGLTHERDSDAIAGDNADIRRLVASDGTNLTFLYDDLYGEARQLVVRGINLLDYTPGGPDRDPAASADRGGSDEIHGESGDDWVYGMRDDDLLFGDAQDDDLIGGWGHDWVSGGTGQDGVLGDDGRIFTSRNGVAGEPLYGIGGFGFLDNSGRCSDADGCLDTLIYTPGHIQEATINVSGQLKKTVDLTPFNTDAALDLAAHNPLYADDILFGGLGDDFLHGGSGDDAISGAEALAESYLQVWAADGTLVGKARSDFDHPYNPGDTLRFNYDARGPHESTRAGQFALYDEYYPRTKITLDANGVQLRDGDGVPLTTGSAWFLNNEVIADGNDRIFGDLGNDWLVGGTGRDDLWGGWGNDLLQADDDLETDTGLNDTTDSPPDGSYEDRAFGGAGVDVLIGNTGGDRLIDYTGEFNSYIVPFAPFGMATVSRQVPPSLYQFLYDLSKSDGADSTRAADQRKGDTTLAARNGEPYGEIGLVTQKDPFWGDQTGAPVDPQPGNIPGGARDVLRSATFSSSALSGFFTDSGSWTISGGTMQVTAASLGGDAVSVFNVDEHLPTYYELEAQIMTRKPTGGWKANAYVIFDYQGPTDFKFAGIDISINKFVMGHRDAGGWVIDVQSPLQVKPDTWYRVLVAVNGTAVTVSVNGRQAFTWTYAKRVIDGVEYGLNTGMVGVGSNNARGGFDDVKVQVLPPQITLDTTEDFGDAVAQLFGSAGTGGWQAAGGGRWTGSPATAGGIALQEIDVGTALHFSSYVELQARLATGGIAGFVFDRYGTDDFKFAAIDVASGTVVIGHHDPRRGWVVDASAAWKPPAGSDHTLQVSLKGASVTVSVNGQLALSHGFNAAVVDGGIGLLARAATASFDSVRVRTNDPAFTAASSASFVPAGAAKPPAGSTIARLTEASLADLVAQARSYWAVRVSGDALQRIDAARVMLADLADLMVGQTLADAVYIDADAAGYGWNNLDPLTVVIRQLGLVAGL